MKLISRPRDCNIRTYIECRYDNNLQSLIIEGEPTMDELLEAWLNIEIDFADLCKNNTGELAKKYKSLTKKRAIKVIEFCFTAINGALPLYEEERALNIIKQACTMLKPTGLLLKWQDDPERFANDFERQKSIYDGKVMQLEELEKEIKDVEVANKEPDTIENFYNLLLSVETLLGFKISEGETSLEKFGIMVANYNRVVATQSKN